MILTDPPQGPSPAARDVAALLAEGERRLARAGIPSPRSECERLLAHALGLERGALWRLSPSAPPPVAAVRRWRRLLHRRLSGEPAAYLLGRKDFWTLRLRVRPGVLVPRPETEALVAFAERLFPSDTRARLLDLGTGTGALALALAALFPTAQVWATDRADEALALAAENAQRTGRRLILRRGGWFSAIPPGRRFALVVANPPYLAPDDPALGGDGLRREPRSALVAADGGLADLRTIVAEAPAYLEAGGWLLLEHAPTQASAVADCLHARGFSRIEPIADPGGMAVGTAARIRSASA